MNKYAIIVAGGQGTRMQSAIPKQFLLVHGKPVLWYSIKAFLDADDAIKIIVALPEDFIEKGLEIIESFQEEKRFMVVPGGITRFHSVKNGLNEIFEESIILVHDAVRCLVTPTLIRDCYEEALHHGNAIPAIQPVDTFRIISGCSNEPVDRSSLRVIQTPQAFQSRILLHAFEQAYQDNFTDEASVVERSGFTIHLVEGEETNIKITRPMDLIIAAGVLLQRTHQP